MYVDYIWVFKDILVDLVSLYIYAYLILYRRYGNRELFVTCALFNVALMLVVMSIVRTDFNLAVGFGLFALLSLITVRSAPFKMSEMAHFFGVIALAVINGSGISDNVFVLMCNVVVVFCAWVLSSWVMRFPANIGIARQVRSMTLVLEYVDLDAMHNAAEMNRKLSDTYGIDVIGFSVLEIDHIRESMKIVVNYEADPAAEVERVNISEYR
jgi:hypothetical protein